MTARIYWFSTSARPSLSWRTSIRIDWSRSIGSKPEITTGFGLFGEALVGLGAGDGRDMRGPDKPVDHADATSRASGAPRIAAIAEGVSTWLQKNDMFVRPAVGGHPHRHRGGGVVVSKPMAKNTTSRSGWRGDLERVGCRRPS